LQLTKASFENYACSGNPEDCNIGLYCTGSLNEVETPVNVGFQYCVKSETEICSASEIAESRWTNPMNSLEY